jgi:preprotein translocase subunit YajC
MKKSSLILIAALVAALSVTGVVAAKPGKPHPAHKTKLHAKGFHGTVAAVGSDSITLTLKKGGSLTLAVTADTKIRVNGAPATLADVLVGYQAVVKRASDGSAQRIDAKDPAFKKVVHGIVDSVGTDSITLKLKKDGSSLTIAVTADTKIRVNGSPGALSDIHAGFRAEVKQNSDGSAKAINAKDPEFKSEVHGLVSAVGTDSITLKLKNGDSVEIAVTSDTKIHLKCGPGTLADIEVGFRAKVKRNSDGSARRIQAVQPHFRCVVHGTVSAVGSDSLTLTLKSGASLTVGVTADTKIFVNGAAGSLSDIQVGYEANVKRNNDGTARRINAHAPDSD